MEVFYSYGNQLTDIVNITSDELNAYPDSNLIRAEQGTRVYKLENNQKRWIKTAEAFNRLNYDWNKIAPVNGVEFNVYASGAVIE